MNRRDCRNMEGMFKKWIEERTKQGPDSQQVQVDRQQIERVLKQQSLVGGQGGRSRKDLPANSSLSQQGEEERPVALEGVDRRRSEVLQGGDRRRVAEGNNSTCSVA